MEGHLVSFQLSTEFVPQSLLELNGQDAIGVVVAAGGEWADGLDEIADIDAFELDGGSYERLAGTYGVERVGGDWFLFVEGFSAIDLSDSDPRVGVWLATDDGRLIGYQDDPGAPTGTYLPSWPSGVYALPISPASGGVMSVQAGDGITVDSTDPQNPVVAAIGGGGGGAVDSVNGQTGAVVLAAADVGAVPTARTVNGQALSSNVTLDHDDVGAAATSHSHPVGDLTATGTPSSSTYLRGDGSWTSPPVGPDDADDISFSPASPGDWTSSPDDVAGALDELGARPSGGGGGDAGDVSFTPGTPGDWTTSPVDVQDALDELGGRSGSGTVTSTDITDSTTVGRAVLTAADAAAARTSLSAASAAQGALADTAVQPGALAGLVTGVGISTVEAITQEDYDLLDPPDPETLYVIVEEGS